jgi:hypothetical protein
MGLAYADDVYRPVYDTFARPVVVTPLASQPGAPAYNNRGVLHSIESEIIGLDGTIISDARTVLDIIIDEYAVVPKQLDIINIPADAGIAGGTFEVSDLSGSTSLGNTGGEITLTLKEIVQAKP